MVTICCTGGFTLEMLSRNGTGKIQQAADQPILSLSPTYRIQQPNRYINMNFIRSIGKKCKSKALHATEAEAGLFFTAGVALNVVLIAMLAFL